MAVYVDREAFIPYRRPDLVELCLQEGKLAASDVPKFRNFCSILSAYYHFQFHQTLENLKTNFAPFDPDADTKEIVEPTPAQKSNMAAKVIADFQTVLERANYTPISQASLQRALQEKSVIELKTDVDFNDFQQMTCYCRGDIYKINLVKKFFKKVEQTIDVFERVVLLIHFQEHKYFEKKKINIQELDFIPGKIYIYLYKNIPKFDLEFLFPNIKISMTWKDRLLLGIPAIGAAIPVMLKILPQLLLILGIILFFTGVPPHLEELKASEQEVRNLMPLLVTVLSLLVTLGGFAFKQYTSYKNKHIKFQKHVTETLFFRNLASNAGVFGALIDSAEEEECKEIILVYYHLLTSNYSLTPRQLDDQIEVWMDDKFGTRIDFDIHGPLRNLEAISGPIISDGEQEVSTPEIPLLTYDTQGNCCVLPLDDALKVLDYIWDQAFLYT
ncbi:MAG: DUF3754 domain-containing protein [Symploca sp. SIO2B6]|nr:DUF3754 domain-containing protein [Symploca sp. SIO2B6]